MPTYEITTDKGKYQVTTEEAQNPGLFDEQTQETTSPQPAKNVGGGFDLLNTIGQFGKGIYNNPIIHPLLKAISQGTGSKAEEAYAGLPIPATTVDKLSSMFGQATGVAATALPLTAGAAALPFVGGSAVAANALGMGAYGGLEATAQNLQGQPTNIGQSIAQNALGGAVMGGAIRAGASFIPKEIPGAERIGSAIGGALGSATMAPEGERGTAGAFGGIMGGVLPSQRFDAVGALANGVGPVKGLGYDKTAKIMGTIFNKSIGDAVRELPRYGGVDEVKKVGEWENTAPDGTKQTMMDVVQATRESGISQIHNVLSDQFEKVLPLIDQTKVGEKGVQFIDELGRFVDKIAEPPSTSTVKAIWDKFQTFLYKTDIPRSTLENAGIKIQETNPQDLSALDKETANKIEALTKHLQTRQTRTLAIQDLPPNLQKQILGQMRGEQDVSLTALDRMKRQLSTYGNKGADTVDKSMARAMADKISGFIKESDTTGSYAQLMDHYRRLMSTEEEVTKWDPIKLAKQYRGMDPTVENTMNNSMKVIDNYFKSDSVKNLLRGNHTNYLTEDLINKYHIYQTLANPTLYGFSHIYPMRVLGGVAAGTMLHPVLGPFAYPVGTVSAWKMSSPKSWMPLLEAIGKGKTTGQSYSPTVGKTGKEALKKLMAVRGNKK